MSENSHLDQIDQLAHIVIVKIGSSALARTKRMRSKFLHGLACDINWLQSKGHQVVLVSSGAIALAKVVGSEDGHDIPTQQALSAIGQPLLMAAYQEAFLKEQLRVGQVLVTHEDLGDRGRSLNLRNALFKLLDMGYIPIINENDSVSFQEISLGDNDQLAAMVAQLLPAKELILLTEPEGLFDKDPSHPDARLLKEVHDAKDLHAIVTKGKSTFGRGGMTTKLEAIMRVFPLGIKARLATFKGKNPLRSAWLGAGTAFLPPPQERTYSARQKFIASTTKAQAKVFIDDGAKKAMEQGASLLPSGILKITGPFRRGDGVAIYYKRQVIGHGIIEFHSKDLQKILGLRSQEFSKILPQVPAKVAIHRNNLVMRISL